MALKKVLLALILAAAASPISAAIEDATAAAPAGTADTRYCMYIEAVTGSRLEQVKCWTREEWSEQGVDVDHDWPEDGVRTMG